jgi:hypothetical protein
MCPAGSFTCVLVGLRQEQGRRQVGADAVRRALDLADGIVDMGAEGMAAAVAVEQRWKDTQRQRGRQEQRCALQARNDHVAEAAGHGIFLGNLFVVLGQRGLESGGDAAILPACTGECVQAMSHLLRIQYARDFQQQRRRPLQLNIQGEQRGS